MYTTVNELGIATAEDAQRSFGRNVRSKIRYTTAT